MAMFVVVALGLANRRHPRSHNIKRVACSSDEKCTTYLRLQEADVNTITQEYMSWRNQKERVTTTYCSAVKRMEVFLQYLAKGGYYHQIGRSEGVAESTAMMYLHSIAVFFQETAAQ